MSKPSGIIDIITDRDPRAKALPSGADLELARQKLLFLTPPTEFAKAFSAISKSLEAEFDAGKPAVRRRVISFMLGVAESLASPVELSHNLQNAKLFGKDRLSSRDAAALAKTAAGVVAEWATRDKKAFVAVTSEIREVDVAVPDGLFAAWAKRWEKRNGRDPYASVDDYLACFAPLYQRGMYYPDLYFARESGKTRTQFLADSSVQAARLRRLGCLGCYTKVRSVDGSAEPTFCFAEPHPGHAEPVEAATLPFRAVYLIRGLGIPGSSETISKFDDILLDGASPVYRKLAAGRAGDNDIRAWFYHLGRTSDEIREYRIKTLVSALKETSKFRSIDAASVRSLRDEPTNTIEFILQLEEAGIEFKPGDEEDAIDHAGALLVKRAAARNKTMPIVIADKRNYLPNIELLDVDYATDSPQVQRDCMMRPVEVDNWKSLREDMSRGRPVPGSIWAKRAEILSAIWPDWERTYKAAGA